VQKAETVNVFGLYYGVVLEAAARVAVECNDSVAFADYYNRCHEQFGSGAYPPLTARLEKLMTAARRRKLAGTGRHDDSIRLITPGRVRNELSSVQSAPDRAAHALSLLVEAAKASAGHLYGIRAADLELIASQAAPAPSVELEEMLRAFLRAQSDEERTRGFDELSDRQSSPDLRADEAELMNFVPVLLTSGRGAGANAVAIVALAFAAGKVSRLSSEIASAVGDELLAARDVTGLTLA
jgi:hypothetical protein